MPSRTIVCLALVAATVSLPTALADDPHPVEVLAHDDADACEGDPPCFEIVDDWDVVYAGEQLEVTFTNEGETPHSLTIVPGSQRNATHENRSRAAIIETGDTDPGASVTETGTVPEGSDTVFLFDEEHEAEGMSLVREIYPAESRYEGGEPCPEGEPSNVTDDGSDPGPCEDRQEEPTSEIPAPLAAILLAFASGAQLGRRRS